MYEVSTEFSELIYDNIREVQVSGTITTITGRAIHLKNSDIKAGSLTITRKAVPSSNFELGGTYIDKLSVEIAKKTELDLISLVGATITFDYSIYNKIGTSYSVNLGTWLIPSDGVYKTNTLIQIKANSNMILFEQALVSEIDSETETNTTLIEGTPLEVLRWCCSNCNVTLANTSLDNFVNNDMLLVVTDDGSCTTYRDVLEYVCSLLCSFATINQSGKLVIKGLSKSATSVFTINPITTYSSKIGEKVVINGINSLVKGVSYSTGVREIGGVLYSLDENPLISSHTKSEIKTSIKNIKTRLSSTEVTDFSIQFNGNPAIEPGDTITFKGKDYLVTSTVFKYRGKSTISGVPFKEGSTRSKSKGLSYNTSSQGGTGGGGGITSETDPVLNSEVGKINKNELDSILSSGSVNLFDVWATEDDKHNYVSLGSVRVGRFDKNALGSVDNRLVLNLNLDCNMFCSPYVDNVSINPVREGISTRYYGVESYYFGQMYLYFKISLRLSSGKVITEKTFSFEAAYNTTTDNSLKEVFERVSALTIDLYAGSPDNNGEDMFLDVSYKCSFSDRRFTTRQNITRTEHGSDGTIELESSDFEDTHYIDGAEGGGTNSISNYDGKSDYEDTNFSFATYTYHSVVDIQGSLDYDLKYEDGTEYKPTQSIPNNKPLSEIVGNKADKASVKELEKSVSTLNNLFSSLDKRVSSLISDFNDLNFTIKDLNSQIHTNSSGLTSLNTLIEAQGVELASIKSDLELANETMNKQASTITAQEDLIASLSSRLSLVEQSIGITSAVLHSLTIPEGYYAFKDDSGIYYVPRNFVFKMVASIEGYDNPQCKFKHRTSPTGEYITDTDFKQGVEADLSIGSNNVTYYYNVDVIAGSQQLTLDTDVQVHSYRNMAISLSASITGQQTHNTKTVLTATPSYGLPAIDNSKYHYEYKFVKRVGNSNASDEVIQDWGTSNTCEFTADYELYANQTVYLFVYVRDSFEEVLSSNRSIYVGALRLSVSVSASTVAVGTPVTVTATPNYGGGEYMYKYQVTSTSSSSSDKIDLTDWVTDSQYIYTPSEVGKRYVVVTVKDQYGIEKSANYGITAS